MKAKVQALRLVSVDGQNCQLHVGAITYFKGDVLRFYWRDPEPEDPKTLAPIIITNAGSAWDEYYSPVTTIVREAGGETTLSAEGRPITRIGDIDLSIGIHPKIVQPLLRGAWQRAREIALELQELFEIEGYRPDGIIVDSGPSWKDRRDVLRRG